MNITDKLEILKTRCDSQAEQLIKLGQLDKGWKGYFVNKMMVGLITNPTMKQELLKEVYHA